jgi:hypothetical protein
VYQRITKSLLKMKTKQGSVLPVKMSLRFRSETVVRCLLTRALTRPCRLDEQRDVQVMMLDTKKMPSNGVKALQHFAA